MNNTTRKHPRTLQEAFGPYTDHRLHEMEEQTPWRCSDLALAAIAVGVLVLISSGVI
jgi:hypothetical protein